MKSRVRKKEKGASARKKINDFKASIPKNKVVIKPKKKLWKDTNAQKKRKVSKRKTARG